jgi:hypothetical protein
VVEGRDIREREREEAEKGRGREGGERLNVTETDVCSVRRE